MKYYQVIYKDRERIGLDFNGEANTVIFNTELEAWEDLLNELGYNDEIAPILMEVSKGFFEVKELEFCEITEDKE